MTRLTAAAIALVKQYEGFVPTPYRDPVGVLTVGYGHVVIPGETFTTITEDEATHLLKTDLARFGGYVLHHITAPLTDDQFSALCSLAFNMGTAPLVGTLGHLLNHGDIQGAADQFTRWVYADCRVYPGLVARRAAERQLFLTRD